MDAQHQDQRIPVVSTTPPPASTPEREMPPGCLACNRSAIAAFMTAHGIDVARFAKCPPTRHAWPDVLPPCGECGSTFIISPSANPKDPTP